ncbi:AMP-binding protein [Aeromicrobium sp. CF4.19]|uniref:AMP-binding protein n=1 Tax=Aeromicrobium sp. CF4.19 TaxID=3373082 RepID=UPI003EE5DAB8
MGGLQVRRWLDAGAAVATSGLLAPPGPRAAAGIVRGLWRSGPTIATLVAVGAARHPHRAVLHDDDGPLTYRELARLVERQAASWHARTGGVDVVAVRCRNHRDFLVGACAAARLGAELVLVGPETPPEQLAAILRRHRPDVVVHDDGDDAAAQHEGGLTGTVASFVLADASLAPATHGPSRITLLTSGTTGVAKGVSRKVDLLALVESGATGMGVLRLRAGDVACVPAPFFHALGFALLVSMLAMGGTVVTHRRFDAERTLEDIREHGATVLTGVPVMLQRLLEARQQGVHDTSSVRVALTGASAIRPSTVVAFQEVFGPVLVNLYGATETGIVSMATPADLQAAPASVGRPGIGVSVRILREDRTRAPAGESGAIFVRGGLVFSGYTPDREASPGAKEVVDAHVSTGDLGHLDAAGRLHVDGRDDEMVVTGGENVFPSEVEAVLTEHPTVDEAVVLGIDDEDLGQVLRAYVRTTDGAEPDREALAPFVRERLERFKTPREWVGVEDFPRGGTGKILRRVLAEG